MKADLKFDKLSIQIQLHCLSDNSCAWTLGGQFSLYTSGRVSCLYNRPYLRRTEQFTQVWLLHGPWVNFERIVHSKRDKMGCYQMRLDESGIVLLMKTSSKAFQSHSFLRYLWLFKDFVKFYSKGFKPVETFVFWDLGVNVKISTKIVNAIGIEVLKLRMNWLWIKKSWY